MIAIKTLRIEDEDEISSALGFLLRDGRASAEVRIRVEAILAAVRARGDEAVLDEVRTHDWPCPDAATLRVSDHEIEAAWEESPGELRVALQNAWRSIQAFHEGQLPAGGDERSWQGARASLRSYPLDAVGLYVPGGRAAYPSTLLMLAVPARIAGVGRMVVGTPAGPDGTVATSVLAAARVAGVSEIVRMGGAAAIGALAFGTETVPRVDKILGPGNVWVAEAKRQVFGLVGIDSIAGPTELVVLSDGRSDPEVVALDLLAQAEHDPLASPVLLTTDPDEPLRVQQALEAALAGSPREAIQRESLEHCGALVHCQGPDVACAAARFLAPEHLAILAAEPEAWADRVPTAAAIFLGGFSPEAAGDYGAGPNHSLPTGGTARFSSPVGVWDFHRIQSRLSLSEEVLEESVPWMATLARAEGLEGHARSLEIRLRRRDA